jgi:hypothetical protein
MKAQSTASSFEASLFDLSNLGQEVKKQDQVPNDQLFNFAGTGSFGPGSMGVNPGYGSPGGMGGMGGMMGMGGMGGMNMGMGGMGGMNMGMGGMGGMGGMNMGMNMGMGGMNMGMPGMPGMPGMQGMQMGGTKPMQWK